MTSVYLVSSGLGLFHYLVLAFAQSVPDVLLATMWKTVADRVILPAKTILDVDALPNLDHVTGLFIHRTITAVGGIIGPIVVAAILTAFGGLDTAESYQPLFLFQGVMNGVIVLLLAS
jgi:hypothetical protein